MNRGRGRHDTSTVLRAVLALWALAGAGLRAHHSGSEYDRRTIEIEGRLVEVAWQNPHVHFLVRTTDPSGKAVTWDIEANSLSIMRRTDATPENSQGRRHHQGGRRPVASEPEPDVGDAHPRRQRPRDRARARHSAAMEHDGRRVEVHLVRRRHGRRHDGRHFPRVEHEVRRTRADCGGGTIR